MSAKKLSTAQALPTPQFLITISTLRILKCNDASRFLKSIERLLTPLIHNNAMRIDFFYLHACVTIL